MARNPREEAKTISKLLFLTQRRAFRKKQQELSNREKLQKFLKYDSGCTGC